VKKMPHDNYAWLDVYGQPQYAALVTAEDDAGAQESHRFRNLSEVCTYLNERVVQSKWWLANGGTWYRCWPGNCYRERLKQEGGIDLHVIGRSQSKGAPVAEADVDVWNDGALTIWLPSWAWREDFLVHEVAHFATPHRYDQHGPLYARNLLEARYLFAGEESGERLEDAYREYGVKIAKGASRGWKEEMK